MEDGDEVEQLVPQPVVGDELLGDLLVPDEVVQVRHEGPEAVARHVLHRHVQGLAGTG